MSSVVSLMVGELGSYLLFVVIWGRGVVGRWVGGSRCVLSWRDEDKAEVVPLYQNLKVEMF